MVKIHVDRVKRKFRILLSEMPVCNVHLGEHFLRKSEIFFYLDLEQMIKANFYETINISCQRLTNVIRDW